MKGLYLDILSRSAFSAVAPGFPHAASMMSVHRGDLMTAFFDSSSQSMIFGYQSRQHAASAVLHWLPASVL